MQKNPVRQDRLTTRERGRSIEQFVKRARSAFYGHLAATRPLTTMQAWRAFAERAGAAAAAWLANLGAISDDAISEVVEEVPTHRMSPTCRDFTKALLFENRRRLLADDE